MSSSDQTSSTDFTAHSSNFSDYVIGVIDRRSEAKVAAAGLIAAGFEGDDVVLSPEASASAPPLQPSEGMEGSLAEPPTTAQELFTEEGIDQELYASERAKGHVVVLVRTTADHEVASARDVLAAHHAHAIRRVSKWTSETLSSE